MFLKGFLLILFILVFNIPYAHGAEKVGVVIDGLTGEALSNVTEALSIPDNFMQDDEVNLIWLHRFERQAHKKIKSALEPFGYYDPVASITLETVEKDTYRLYIKVTPGEPVRVTGVHIRVNGPGSDEAALKALVSSFPLKESDVLLHATYEKGKGELQGQALNLGYLDADFPVHKILVSQKKLSASIELVLETGPRYYFGEIHFEGAGPYPLNFLERYLSFHTGDTFSSRELGETQLNLLNSERFSEVIVSADKTTAEELLADFDKIDYLITGVGTGGHITGVAEILKGKFPDLKVFAVEPAASPVISGGNPGPHPIQGIGAGFIPVNLHTDVLDGTIQITKEEAFEYAQKAAKEEGLLVGISSGASLAAVAKKLPEIPEASTIVTFSYDTGERYLSIEGLFN